MKTNRFPEHVAEEVVRAGAALTFLLSLLAVLLRLPCLALILAADFGIRAFVTPRWSLLTILSKRVLVPLLGFHGHPISFAPKRFAASIGFSLSSAALLLSLFLASWAWIIPLTVLCLFSALESFLGFCAGCKIYGLLMRWQIVPEDHCPHCALQ
ncbi:MAG: DUF4395 domain-containing protein [Spirochaetaceae bacterium]|nr:MAG: DUF4395 domain-containing protein [Spirochaetaceae bacterium]